LAGKDKPVQEIEVRAGLPVLARFANNMLHPETARARFDAARAALLAGDLVGATRGFDAVAADPAADPALAEAARVLADASREMARRGFALREPLSGKPGAPGRLDRSGRGELAWFTTFYGIWAADGLGYVSGLEDGKGYLALTIAGAGAGLATSLAATRTGAMSRGRAATLQAATTWASVNAATLAAIADAEGKASVGATIATGVAALAASASLTRGGAPSEGDVSLVNSGGFWGLTAGALSLTFLDDPSSRQVGWVLLAGADAGLLAGWGLARRHDVSRGRALVVDAGGLLGGLVGVAIPVFAESGDPRAYGGAALAGIATGLLVGTRLSRDWDREEGAAARAPSAAPFATHLADGTLVAGMAGSF